MYDYLSGFILCPIATLSEMPAFASTSEAIFWRAGVAPLPMKFVLFFMAAKYLYFSFH